MIEEYSKSTREVPKESLFTAVEIDLLKYIVLNFKDGAHKLNLAKKQNQAVLREPIIKSILDKLNKN